MDIFFIINSTIAFLSDHQILTYLVLFFGSFFEKIIVISFFVYGEMFFLIGAILAGMGVLNIWWVVLILYLGGFIGDSISYFLGRKYGIFLYKYFENKNIFKIYINEKNYTIGLKFFKKYGGYSVFFARFLGPVSWITPFLAGVHKLKYKTFLRYDFPAIVLGIGQFIVAGYFIGIYYKIILDLFLKYLFILLFIVLVLLYIYIYLKKKKYIPQFKERWNSSKKRLFIITIKHFVLITITTTIIFLFFLIYLSFVYNGPVTLAKSTINKTILLNSAYLNNCKNLNTYYPYSKSNIIQPINIILVTNKNIPEILDKDWIKIGIFKKNKSSVRGFISSVKKKTLPISNLYVNKISQDSAYQYKNNSILKREHIRFWNFTDKNNSNQKIYLGSISNDDGLTFKLYNYFITPVHEISQNIDKSREFFKNYLLNQKNISCGYIKTTCEVKKNKHADEQQYYTDGKILLCNVK